MKKLASGKIVARIRSLSFEDLMIESAVECTSADRLASAQRRGVIIW